MCDELAVGKEDRVEGGKSGIEKKENKRKGTNPGLE